MGDEEPPNQYGSGGVGGFDGRVIAWSQANLSSIGLKSFDTSMWYDSTGQAVSFFGGKWCMPSISGLIPYGAGQIYHLGPLDRQVFRETSEGYQPTFYTDTQLSFNPSSDLFSMLQSNGSSMEFSDNGMPKSSSNAGFQAAQYEYESTHDRLERVYGVTDGIPWEYRFDWDDSFSKIKEIIYKVDSRETYKTSYKYGGTFNSDLETVKTYENSALSGAAAWTKLILAERFTYHENGTLRHILPPAEYRQIEVNGNTPDTLTLAELDSLAETEYQYELSGRVEAMHTHGRQFTYQFLYGYLNYPLDLNTDWSTTFKIIQPDGVAITYYLNRTGQTILKEVRESGNVWYPVFQEYDSKGRLSQSFDAEAIASVDFSAAVPVTFERFKGRIEQRQYDDYTSGQLVEVSIREGTSGNFRKLRSRQYSYHVPGSSMAPIYRVSSETVYKGYMDDEPITTFYDYDWHAGTYQVSKITTTLPTVEAGENGRGQTVTTETHYDLDGYQIENVDGNGTSTTYAYDKLRGGLIRKIVDPTGLNFQTDYELDERGRTVLELGPVHEIDISYVPTLIRSAVWNYYFDSKWEKWSFRGYRVDATGVDQIVGPINIQQSCEAPPADYTEFSGWRQNVTFDVVYPVAGIPAPSFIPGARRRWKIGLINQAQQLKEEWSYFSIPIAGGYGLQSVNYGKKLYGYDVAGRLNETMCAGGTIDKTTFNPMGWPVKEELGTIAGLTVTETKLYDKNGNLTRSIRPVDSTTANDRITDFRYDFRNRLIETENVVEQAAGSSSTWTLITRHQYDNRDLKIKQTRYSGSVLDANRLDHQETDYDVRGRLYRSRVYAVSSTGVLGNSLVSNRYYDKVGRVLRDAPAGSSLFTATRYDRAGRPEQVYQAYEPLGHVSGSDPSAITTAIVMEQQEHTWDAGGNRIATVTRKRYDNATGTGALLDPAGGIEPKGRPGYNSSYPDGIGRTAVEADFGTYGGLAWSRSASPPIALDDVLLRTYQYNTVGNVSFRGDTTALNLTYTYDAADRVVSIYDGNTSYFEYTDDGWLKKLKTNNTSTGQQVTEWIYGVSPGTGSALHSNRLVYQKVYPDSSSDRITYRYNRQLETFGMTDQLGTVHAYSYDKLGRPVVDAVTTFGSSVDSTVGSLETTYNARGLTERFTSKDPSGSTVINDVRREYNDFNQLVDDYQEHAGAVNTSVTPKVSYVYNNGSSNTIRPGGVAYPGGYMTLTLYISDMAKFLSRPDGSGTILDPDATFRYLGLGTIVGLKYDSGNAEWTLQNGGTGEGGDQYTGINRYGWLVETIWKTYSSTLVHSNYGHNRAGQVKWRRDNLAVAPGHPPQDLYYDYTSLMQVGGQTRGTLDPASGPYYGIDYASLQDAETFEYDPTRYWKSFAHADYTVSPTVNRAENRTHNGANEITGITDAYYGGPALQQPVYDAAGNMTTIPRPSDRLLGYTLVWDAWNRLKQVKAGSTVVASYAYDALTRRTSKTNASETREYYYDKQWRSIEERVSGVTVTRHLWSPVDRWTLINRWRQLSSTVEEFLWCLKDHLDPVAMMDGTGVVVERFGYDTFGKVRVMEPDFDSRSSSSFDRSFLFHGEFLDTDTGLYNYGYRYYHTQLGRWISRDPIGENRGYNLYVYVKNKPTSEIDFVGLYCGGFEITRATVEEAQSPRWKKDIPFNCPKGLKGYKFRYIQDNCDCPCKVPKIIQSIGFKASWGQSYKSEVDDGGRDSSPFYQDNGGAYDGDGFLYDSPAAGGLSSDGRGNVSGEYIVSLCTVCMDGGSPVALGCTSFAFVSTPNSGDLIPRVGGAEPFGDGGFSVPALNPTEDFRKAWRKWKKEYRDENHGANWWTGTK